MKEVSYVIKGRKFLTIVTFIKCDVTNAFLHTRLRSMCKERKKVISKKGVFFLKRKEEQLPALNSIDFI